MNTDQIYIDTLKDQIKSGMYDHLFQEKLRDGVYLKKKDLVFLDIGANIGLVSVYAVPFCKRIVAVEPCKETYDRLKENTRIYTMIETVRAALTPMDGPHEFFVNDINFTASSTVNTYGQRIEVQGKTLQTILRENDLRHVDVCKCDAEGSEGESLTFDQLQGAFGVIDKWYIEFHNCPKTDWQHKLGSTVGNLARLGYTKMQVDGMSLTATQS